MMLKVGSKVKCIEDGIIPDFLLEITKNFPNWVKSGTDYTIRNIFIMTGDNPNIKIVSVHLNEIVNPPIKMDGLPYLMEPAFNVVRFALYPEPIKLDISAN